MTDYPLLSPGVPVLRRGPRELQVGFDSASAVIVPNADEGLQDLLRLLDGCRSRQTIARSATSRGLAPGRVEEVVAELERASLLTDGRADPARRNDSAPQLRLIGAGTVGRAVADLLAPSLGRAHVVDGEPTDPHLYPTAGALGTQADALAAHLRRSAGLRVSVWNHWSKPDGVRLDLTVVTSGMVETDRAVPDALLRTDQPHLFVRASEAGGVVGPLVIPGSTSCLHCTDLYRRDRDASWPLLLAQLTRLPATPNSLVASWVGATAATQALCFLAGGRPETCGATLELSASDHRVRWRPWPAHPGCGCGWSAPAE